MSDIRFKPRRLGCVLLALLVPLVCSGQLAADEAARSDADVVDAIAPPKFLAAWGEAGTGDGQFQSAIGIAINAAGELLITDARRDCVQRFTRDGKFLDKVSTGSFPGGIAIDREGLIYVAVMMDHKISVFRRKQSSPQEPPAAPACELVREWGTKGTLDGQFDQPGGLAFAPDGSLLVCDQVNHRVQRFTPEGNFLAKWGEYGDAPGQFGKPEPPTHRVGGPCFVAVDREGNVFTTEPTAGRIQKFSPEGAFLGAWGSNEVRAGGFGGNAVLPGPIAILFDRHNRAWISATNHRVQLFTADGHYLTGLGTTATSGSDTGQFHTPHGIALDSDGVLYVVDTQNHRVQTFAFDTDQP